MRKITGVQIITFASLLTLALMLGIGTTALFFGSLRLGDFKGVALVSVGVIITYLYAFLVYRLFLQVMPLEEGPIAAGSRAEFAAQVNILFYLLIFNSLIRTHFLPVPLLRFVYIALGARLGRNSYSAGVILDPPLTSLGDNCLIGHDAVLFSHAIEGDHLSLGAIRIGNDVTIGATAVVMSDVTIGDGAIVSAGAVVTKGSRIGPGEVWGGVPARLLRERR